MIFTKDGNTAVSFKWVAPTKRTDGTAYGTADHAGYELGVSDPANSTDGFSPFVNVPAAYDITEWPLANLGIAEEGTYEVALRTVDKGGRTSKWSSPLVFDVGLANPNEPTGFGVL